MHSLLRLSVGAVVVTVAVVVNRAVSLIVAWMMMLTLIMRMLMIYLTSASSSPGAQPASVRHFKLNHFTFYSFFTLYSSSYFYF